MNCARSVVIGALCLLVGCAGHPVARREVQHNRYTPYAGAPVDQFRAYRFSNWEVVGDTQLVIWTEFQDAYLIKLRSPCSELPWAEYIAVTTTVGTVTHLDSIWVGRHMSCMIEEIRPVNIRQMQRDLKNKTPSAAPPPPAGRQATA